MSQLNASNFVAGTTSVSTSGVSLPSFTAGNKPSNVPVGTMILNGDNGKIEVWNGFNWITIGGGFSDGSSEEKAFANLSDIPTNTYTGIQYLYTTLNNQVAPFQIAVNFDIANGPWYMASFVMPTEFAWNTDGVNSTVAAGVYNDNNSTHSSTTRPRRTGTIVSRGSNLRVGEIYTPQQVESVSDSNARGWYVGGSGYNTGFYAISYYNHASQTTFTSAQVTALRSIATSMAPQTPHTALEIDAQGLGAVSPWIGGNFTGNIGGHANWIRDANNVELRATPSENASDERGAAWYWRPGFYQAELFGGGSFDYAPGAASGIVADINDGLPTSFILPTQIKFSGTTGGGSMFGTAYHTDTGWNNRWNDRNYFLFK